MVLGALHETLIRRLFQTSFFFLYSDKMCDQISDAVLDAYLALDPDSKVACGKLSLNDI